MSSSDTRNPPGPDDPNPDEGGIAPDTRSERDLYGTKLTAAKLRGDTGLPPDVTREFEASADNLTLKAAAQGMSLEIYKSLYGG